MSSTIHLKEQPISCLEVFEIYLSFFKDTYYVYYTNVAN